MTPGDGAAKLRWLPPLNSRRYYLLLAFLAMFVLGPLGAVVGAFMLFAIGFNVGGQVLAGILGSAVTYGYGAEGKHGANYMQTAAASVAAIGSLAVLIQARTWLGLAPIPPLMLMLYVCSIGMFGIGIGMLYTPLVVDRMKLMFPSGLAVANILRSLTDPKLLRASIAKLGTGTALGFALGIASSKLKTLEGIGLSMATVGAGMMISARIAVPGFLMALVGAELSPWLVSIGWLPEGAPFRKIGFVIGLGMILGAAAIDIAIIFVKAFIQLRKTKTTATGAPAPDWKRTNTRFLVLWVIAWGAVVYLLGTKMLSLPAAPLLLAMGLVFVFLLVNGISMGITDSNPVSAAFVIGVFLMSTIGLKDINVGLMCATVLLVACSVGVDMQQDRSTGWRLGTNRVIQFVYQNLGILTGAVLCVLLASWFLSAYPVLQVNQFGLADAAKTPEMKKWSSAFTYKLVGVLQELSHPNPHFTTALGIGVSIGAVTNILRKLLGIWKRYQTFVAGGKVGFGAGFVVDVFVIPSPYALSTGGFLEFMTTVWLAFGGILSSFAKAMQNEAKTPTEKVEAKADEEEAKVGEDEMSTTSLVGGGLIAGETLGVLVLAGIALLATIF